MTGTALIVVDMQNAFIEPTADLAVQGAARVVQAVNARVAEAVRQHWPIFYTRDVAPVQLPADDPNRTCGLHRDLDVRGTVVHKGPGKDGGFSGFVLAGAGQGTGGLSELAALLRESEVDSVEVVGLAADVCVAATARDAHRLGYRVTVALDATAFVHAHPGGDDAAIADLRAAGITVT